MSVRRIPSDTIERQRRAADPGVSAWVAANAGAGKTHVLASRVIRLLLDGTDPQKILCLTYTKAAAANMANRVFDTLGEWTMLDDATLSARIAAVEGVEPDAGKLARARRLFARALETPGGLKIQTIHAFCEAILHQFPLEANIAGHFELLDGRMEEALVAEARRELLTGAVHDDSGALGVAFGAVLAAGGESGLDRLLGEIVQKRDGLRAFIDQCGGAEGCHDALREEFDFAEGATAEEIAAAAWPLPGCNPAYLKKIDAWAFENGAKRARESFTYAAVLACAETDPLARLEKAAAALLKSDGDVYNTDKLFTKSMRTAFPDLAERYVKAAEAAHAAKDRIALLAMLEATRAALTVADQLIGRYEALKRGRGFLDFNDLIMRTAHLLRRADAGPWVQYKLDRGIDHILLDEAQDTSPQQWDVIRSMTSEFFTGEGARANILRTIFAVGDEKQSIYSFQGAEPKAFAEMRHDFSARARDARKGFRPERLPYSFRSTPDVLSAVDLVFKATHARKGLTGDPEEIEHLAIRSSDPGYVELWPSVGAEAVEEPEDWREGVDHASAPAVRLAEHIALTVKGWIASGEIIEGRGARVGPGDIMVLVRKRDRFIHALSRRLKELDIPVAGADRLSLPGHIAVKDLAAIGRFALQPHDDLSLAALLKSPVFGYDDDDLIALSAGRPHSQSLWSRLRARADHDERCQHAVRQLAAWRNEAGYKPAVDFYATVLGRDGVRRAMMARLGPEAGEIIDEFMNFVLAQERTGAGDLESFLAILSAGGPEIKREMDQIRDEVRIMTVHAAKGLEAPIVFLVDSGSEPFNTAHRPHLVAYPPQTGAWEGKGWLWRAGAALKNTVLGALDQEFAERAEEEYRRLLYVGMTRAEDRLIVCGYHGTRGPNGLTWHRLVREGLERSEATVTFDNAIIGVEALRYRITQGVPVKGKAKAQGKTEPDLPLPFDPAVRLAPPADMPRPLSPSGAALLIEPGPERDTLSRSPVFDGTQEPGLAIRRGLAVHKMLQMLPAVPAGERAAGARTWLERTAADWPHEECEEALGAVFRILSDPDFAPVFAEGSRAEVPVMGTIAIKGRDHLVSGVIDRLAVTGSDVLVVDYKTNRPPPRTAQEVPSGHVAQMALYRELLRPLYPRHSIRCALLYTEAARLIVLGEDVMAASLARLSRA